MDKKAIEDAGKVLAEAGAKTATEEPKTVSYGGYDLTDYSKDMEKMGLSITSVKGGIVGDKGEERHVLLVSSYNPKTQVTVTDYLAQPEGDGNKLDSKDLAYRDIRTNNNDLHIYGGKDNSGMFAMNVESGVVDGRTVWGLSINSMKDMTEAAALDPQRIRNDAAPSMVKNKKDFLVPVKRSEPNPSQEYYFDPNQMPILKRDVVEVKDVAAAAAKATEGKATDVTPDNKIVAKTTPPAAGGAPEQQGRAH